MTSEKAQLWQTKLAEARTDLLAVLNALSAEQWDSVVFSEGDEWTVSTIVSHLIDGEKGMSIQVHKIRKGEQTVPDNFDLDRWNAGVKKRMGTPTPEELLAGLEATRARTLEGLNSLNDEEWGLTGRHPSRGVISIAQYYETISGHDRGHAEDIRAALAGSGE